MDNSLLHFAQLLIMSNRYEQALKDKCDEQTMMAYYKGLTQIATSNNNSDEALVREQNIMELKFSRQNAFTLPEGILLPSGFNQIISTFFSQSQTSLDRPLHHNEKAVEYYTLASDENVTLPLLSK
jgi:hypothetical protein